MYLVWTNPDNIACHRSAVVFAPKMRSRLCRMSRYLTISHMQFYQLMTEGPISYTLYVSLPICADRRKWWAGEMGEWVEVNIVDDRVDCVCDEARNNRWKEDARSPILESLHRV